MSRSPRTLAIVALCLGLASPLAAIAADAAPRLSISGTSTVRSWTCTVEGRLEIEPASDRDPLPGFPGGIESAELTLAIGDIECPEELMMEHLREALDEPDYPQIVYRLESYALATGNTAEAEGTMTIHGTTRSIRLDIEIDESEAPARALGQTSIDMSEFGVTPPAVWGGLLKVGAVVSIKFEMALPGGE